MAESDERQSTSTDAIARSLGQCFPFSTLSGTARESLAPRIQLRPFRRGDTLIAQGEDADSLLLIVEGAADVLLDSQDGDGSGSRKIGAVKARDVVGEMALLTRGARTASVVATEDGLALELPSADFHDLVSTRPTLAVAMTRLLEKRLGLSGGDSLFDKRLRGYHIRRFLGRGATSVVYEAHHEGTDRDVALKMLGHTLMYDDVAVARFEREAEMVRGIEHPNIVRVYDAFSAFRTQFIAMQLMRGPDLATANQRSGPWPEAAVRHAVGQIAAGLNHAHGHGIVHRDLKPSNVLLDTDGTLRLTDFGVALMHGDPRLTSTESLVGTPVYMAPEQLRGQEPTQACDLYALGLVALELLTGQRPFPQTDVNELVEAKLNTSLPPRRKIRPLPSRAMYKFLESTFQLEAAARTADLAELLKWAGPVPRDYCRPAEDRGEGAAVAG